MRSSSSNSPLVRLLLLGALLSPVACESTPPHASQPAPSSQPSGKAEISNEFTATARVTAIAPAERRVTLCREDGTMFDVVVSNEARNFDQIAVGDVVRIRYKETLMARVLPVGTPVGPAEGAVVAARAQPGEKPGAGVGAVVSLRVRVESIDLDRGVVVFSPASGELIARNVRTPQGREFIKGLKVGDIVQLDYAEVLGLAVEEL